jgi:heterodisulfide reductase subunit A
VEKERVEEQVVNIPASSNTGDVMVVGAGISGIQAALDLAYTGFKVYLVDKSPAIGGKMAQLDKTFPTNDCSMCIESPKFIEANRHPNIEILTYTDVDRVEGQPGEFTVTLIKKPRYIRTEECRGCTTCTEYCPVMVPDKYNQNLSLNKASHVHFSQAVPLIPYIDPDQCLFLQGEKCTICVGACKNKAIDLHQKPEKLEVEVGAIVLAPGYEPFDPRVRGDYGYGKMENVVTSLDFERILCATGPYEGEIRRPSDKKHPHRIAWIQCVGSRRVTPGDNSYCSAVCCAYTQKQVILAKDHDAEAECTVFHNDIRSFGKDFERFYQRAENLPGVRFIRSYVSLGREIPETKNVTLRYATAEDGVKEEEFDMVVLSVGLNPPADVEQLAQKFGIELDSHGFCKTNPVNPIETTRPGVFVSGAFQGPIDIPESVMTASGAGSLCSQLLYYQRGNLARERQYPPERDVSEEQPRIGVFVCHCGANIGRVVNVPSVVEYALTLPNVVHAQEALFACSTDTARKISETIKETGLNRVVVAACTPRTHEQLFRDTVREGGINPYYFELANIREHCSWVHSKEKEVATQKAKDIVRMSVARTALLAPLKELDLPVDKRALVVGGGVAGMTSGLSLANQGFDVYLVEKDKDLGGMARRIHSTLEGVDVQAYLSDIIRKVYRHPSLHVTTDAVITEASGYVGNFITKVECRGLVKEIHHGITIIATGAEEYKPTEYLYGKDERVSTQLELGEKIANKDEKVIKSQSLVMIQCVGCRNEVRNYCSRVCCSHSIKNALKLKEIRPEMDIYVLYRDMRTYGYKEDYYRAASEKDVKFIRFEADDKPQVEAGESEDGRPVLKVTVTDPVLGKKLSLDADYLALAAAVIPSSTNAEIAM